MVNNGNNGRHQTKLATNHHTNQVWLTNPKESKKEAAKPTYQGSPSPINGGGEEREREVKTVREKTKEGERCEAERPSLSV